jgi:hypothetical protein
MQRRTTRTTGILARVRAHLRGDRYMVDAYPPASAAPEAIPDPVPVARRPPRGKEG